MSKSEDIQPDALSEIEIQEMMRDYERYHAALALMRVVARARREMHDSDLNQLSWRTRVDMGAALTHARLWFNVREDDLNEQWIWAQP